MDDKLLRITINNHDAVDLNVLANSLNAFAQLYDSCLLKSDITSFKKEERKLLVKDVRQGSIIIDIVGAIAPLDVATSLNTIIVFGEFLKNMANFFAKKEDKLYDFSKRDSENFITALEPIAQDSNGGMNISIVNIGDGSVYAPVLFTDTMDSNARQNIARDYRQSLQTQDSSIDFYEKLLKLVITDKNTIKGIIIDFQAKERKLLLNAQMQQQILKDQEKPFSVYYLVNGKIMKDGDKIIAYKIDEIQDTIEDD